MLGQRMTLYKIREYYYCNLCTGPRHWTLGLLLGENGSDEGNPIITIDPPIGKSKYGEIDSENVLVAVIDGFTAINTGYRIKEIRYPKDDSIDPGGFKRCAFLIAQKISDKSNWDLK